MRYFAHELSVAVHSLGGMEALGVKIASADACVQTQNAVAQGCGHLYNVMYKKAMAETIIGPPEYIRVVQFMDKVATVLEKKPMTTDMRYKIAAVVLADSTLEELMKTDNLQERRKYAEAQMFGREFMVELLRKVL